MKRGLGDSYGVVPRRSAWGVDDFTWGAGMLDGVNFRFLRNISLRPDHSTWAGKVNPELLWRVREFSPDAVWVSGYTTLFTWFSFLAATISRVPVIYSSDSNVLLEPSGLKGHLKNAILRRLYARFRAFLVVGTMNAKHYLKYGVPERKCHTFPFAVDNRAFREAAKTVMPNRQQTRKSWGVKEGNEILLFVGRLEREKRPEDIIRAAEILGDAHVVFAGTGSLSEQLGVLAKKKIGGRSTFLGFVPQDELPSVYTASDILVLPSGFEAWGLVINEALACGLCAVASDRVGAAWDLLPQEARFSVGDVTSLVEAVRFYRLRRRQLGDLAEDSKRRVEPFSYRADTIGLKSALRSIVAASGPLGAL